MFTYKLTMYYLLPRNSIVSAKRLYVLRSSAHLELVLRFARNWAYVDKCRRTYAEPYALTVIVRWEDLEKS